AIEMPGLTGHMLVASLLRARRVNDEVAAARAIVKRSSDAPTGRLIMALLSLRAAAHVVPVIDLAGDRVDLREELAELYADTLEMCDPQLILSANAPELPRAPNTLAAHEPAILRLCRDSVGRAALSAGGSARGRDMV